LGKKTNNLCCEQPACIELQKKYDKEITNIMISLLREKPICAWAKEALLKYLSHRTTVSAAAIHSDLTVREINNFVNILVPAEHVKTIEQTLKYLAQIDEAIKRNGH